MHTVTVWYTETETPPAGFVGGLQASVESSQINALGTALSAEALLKQVALSEGGVLKFRLNVCRPANRPEPEFKTPRTAWTVRPALDDHENGCVRGDAPKGEFGGAVESQISGQAVWVCPLNVRVLLEHEVAAGICHWCRREDTRCRYE